MLELKSIVKDYPTGDASVRALGGITLSFRRSEFVSILGPSGSGKTTLLNIVGGLDSYTSGDLIINGRSTREFHAYDWDSYRNKCIGFVFQSYNLIPHLSVLKNVELALTISGKSKADRREKALTALKKVGLSDEKDKRPNQLSGGQMQRVAIARAIVNDPEIILADEPTGALDSVISVQIADLLKEISRDRLVIMVTHNDALAEKYSTRIIKLLDGEKVSDSNPYDPTQEERLSEIKHEREKRGEPFKAEEYSPERYPDPLAPLLDKKGKKRQIKAVRSTLNREEIKQQKREAREERKRRKSEMQRTSMKFITALGLSGRNLATKKTRTALVSVAASIGIIGVALVLSISNGFSAYIEKLQTETLAGFPVSITPKAVDIEDFTSSIFGTDDRFTPFPTDGRVEIYSKSIDSYVHINDISDDYLEYLRGLDKSLTNAIDYANAVRMNIVSKSGEKYSLYSATSASASITSSNFLTELIDNPSFITGTYDVIKGRYPTGANELAVVIDRYNRIPAATLERFGIRFERGDDGKISLDDLINSAPEFKVIINENFYKDGNITVDTSEPALKKMYDEENNGNIPLKIVGVMRVKPSAPLALYGVGLVHTKALTDAVIALNKNSAMLSRQRIEFDTPYGEGLSIPAGRPFYSVAGLSEQNIEDWKNAESDLREELYKYDFTDDDIDYLIDMGYRDPSLSFVPADKVDEETMQLLRDAVAITNLFQKMINQAKTSALEALGAAERPSSIYIYPKNFECKNKITAYLDAYNRDNPNNTVMYTDASEILTVSLGNMVNIVSYVLVAFAAVSLVVSSIMIGIITYVSVIERTKEIGVLRSIGARKKDVSRVFNAETMIIGLIAGLIGVAFAALLNIPINLILAAVIKAHGATGLGIGNLAVMHPLHALVLIAISVLLTFISGFIPSRIAAEKDPVTALRTE